MAYSSFSPSRAQAIQNAVDKAKQAEIVSEVEFVIDISLNVGNGKFILLPYVLSLNPDWLIKNKSISEEQKGLVAKLLKAGEVKLAPGEKLTLPPSKLELRRKVLASKETLSEETEKALDDFFANL